MPEAPKSGLRQASGAAAQEKVAERFEAILSACCLPSTAIEMIDDPKQRTIFRGVAAAAEAPEVKHAFSIVYQDLGPVRVVARLYALVGKML